MVLASWYTAVVYHTKLSGGISMAYRLRIRNRADGKSMLCGHHN